MIDLLPLVNKTVPFKFRGAELRLDLSHALFSSFEVDAGTRILLKAVGHDEVLLASRLVLDAGCGVGVIGLAVAAALPGARVEARDRDFLACAFTERNRARAKLPNLQVTPGLLALESAEGWGGKVYDYILTNIPAKAGAPVLEAFFTRALAHLSPGGRLAVVIVKPLAEEARAWLGQAGFSFVGEERGANHLAFVVAAPGVFKQGPELPAFPGGGQEGRTAASQPFIAFPGLDLSLYERRRGNFKLAGASYAASGFWGLPEFDTVGYDQAAAAELAEKVVPGSLIRDALIVNPGIGHLALWASRRLGPQTLTAASRDLLSLAATAANLALQPNSRLHYRAMSSLELGSLDPASLDLLACFPDVVPEYDWIGPLWADAARLLKRGAILIVSCQPTELTRLAKRRPQGWKLRGEKRKKGFVAAAWERC
jgi:precorrin-6B methylase 2